MTARGAEGAGQRRAYSYATAAADYSVPVAKLRSAVAAGKIRTRTEGGLILLNPEDLERLYGFSQPAPARREPSAGARALAKELLS